MAVVANPFLMGQSEQMLMDQPRFRLPRVSSSATLRSDPFPSESGPFKPLVKRKRSWDKTAGPPRNRKRVFSYTTDPEMETYRGHVRAPADAVILFEACRLGLLPRVQRRLSEKERQSIKSGSVFVWDEREAGMRRWTDGKSWSASRVSGSFLTYREMEGKRGGGGSGFPSTPSTSRSNGTRTPESGRGNESELDGAGGDEGPDGYRYKPDGLIKQSFSITTSSGNHLHLISYYSRSHPASQQLPTPSTDPSLRHIRPAKGMYPESTVHEHQNIPAVTRSPMASTGYQTVPQMANYARNPPHWSPQTSQYGWSTPPGHPSQPSPQQPAYPYQYGNSPSYYNHPPPPAQPATNGHSPHPYPHGGAPPTSQPPAPSHPPYDDRRSPTSQPLDPNLPAYDPRRQPAVENHGPPPPVHHPHDTTYGQGHGSRDGHQQPHYDPKAYPARSAPPQDVRPPPTQYSSQPPRPPISTYPPSQSQYYTPPSQNISPNDSRPQYQQHATPAHHQSGPPPHTGPPPASQYPSSAAPGMQIDPRLTHSPRSQHPPYSGDPNRKPGHFGSRSEGPNNNVSPSDSRGPQQASTVPSIGALMNGSADHSYSNGNTRSPNGHGHLVNGQSAGSMSADRSPIGGAGGGPKKDGPQDIPSDKVGFSEDMRALKVLDKGFR